MPVYHSGKLSQTDRPHYTLPLRPQTKDLTVPFAPRNLMVTSPYIVGMADVRWDNPRLVPQNNGLEILGCNVYRSTDSPEGTYIKINDVPIGSFFYRDQTLEQYVLQEDVTNTLRINEPDNRWLVYTRNKPVIMPGTNGQPSFRAQDIKVEIDDGDGHWLEVPAFQLNGLIGEITLISAPTFNHVVEQIIPPRLPTPPNGRVRVSYFWLRHSVLSRLSQRIFYKVSTVARDPNNPAGTIETPLPEISARSLYDIDEVDWVWREAIRRNRWLLEQAGERVKVFIRKWMGTKCPSHDTLYGQGYADCEQCYGTGWEGGYEGPYDIIIAPPETEKMIELMDMGLHIRYDWATWSSDYPILNERDVVVRQNNERFVVGPVNYQGSRGAIYQQHFTIAHVDERDIRYKIPITGGENGVPASTDLFREDRKSPASPVINDKPEIDKSRIIRGRTVTFENISWVFCGFLFLDSVYSILCKTINLIA